jgi:hypothetical protein
MIGTIGGGIRGSAVVSAVQSGHSASFAESIEPAGAEALGLGRVTKSLSSSEGSDGNAVGTAAPANEKSNANDPPLDGSGAAERYFSSVAADAAPNAIGANDELAAGT